MKITVLTLFPEMYESVVTASLLGKSKATIERVHIRDFSTNKHHNIDDAPYGGGAGLLMQVEPIHRALDFVDKDHTARRILMSPQGTPLTQAKLQALSELEELVLIAGHYEGFDERVRAFIDEEISIGDYVLTGGELPSMVLIDGVVRLIEGTVGNPESLIGDSFQRPRLEGPQYTRPEDYLGMKVPEVLLSGNHKLIARYHTKESLRRTYLRRPELLVDLTVVEQELMDEILKELEASLKS
jgi:tRNA (guanine37-N1)-methyltransferase